ncbi:MULTISPECIES: ABC transporter substrate-binding protein [unclassified Candidatus Accumulibacter]|nr:MULTISPECIES: ABC transporter substrate-binding protein [unclassified Candidatus Accumulibacter]MQM35432.1 ABC transporter permease [Candidatus Accumulibacter phosphatis]HRE69190.1 ABC transporter substrate-binding protein [Accumulibacter sp.]HRE86628.1 ABC transporter substrate-binding protein [Accumulibacter sp.]HRI93650.1 ABC transporter substrate-binding protein [Accumulibacter sp.]
MLIPAANIAAAQTSPGTMKLSDNTVKIGVLTDMSGVYSDLGGQGAVTAVQMAIDDYKAQYKPKFKIEMVYADHQNKADVGSNKVREWYDTEGVDMVTDVLNSGVALAVAKVTQEKKRIVMFVGSASTRLTDQDCTPNTVHYAYDTYSLANVAGKAIVKNGGDTWFFLTADYAFGQSLEKDTTDVIKANGGKVLGSVRHPLNASDFSSYLLQAQASKAKIIGLANAGGDTINAIKAASEFGITKNQQLAGLLMFITDIHALGLQTTQGMLLTAGFYWDRDEDTRKFSKRYFEKTKRNPTMVQAGDYSAVTTYLKAVQAAGTDDAEAVMAKMKAMPINDFFAKNGKIRVDGRMIHDMYLMQVKKPSESKYPWDYYDIKSVVPGDEAFQPLSVSKCPLVKK